MRWTGRLAFVSASVWLVLGVSSGAHAQCVLPFQLTNADLADAAKLTANFNALAKCISSSKLPNSVQYNSGGGTLSGTPPLTDGQLLIGSTGNPPSPQSLTPGTAIDIVNGAGSFTVSATSALAGTGLYRQVMSDTPTSASTGLSNWLNQGTATVIDSAVGVCIDAPGTGTTANILGRFKSAPNYIQVMQWNSATSFNAAAFSTPINGFSQPVWFQIADDGTNVSFAFSQDGANYLPVFSSAKSSGFLGTAGYSNVIFMVNPRGNSDTIGTLMSWTQL